jgi:hypothetical protein
MDQTRQVQVDPERARQVVSDLALSAGMVAQDAYAPDEVVALLAALDYDATPNTLAEFQRKRYVPAVEGDWSPVDVYCLLAALESRRRWRPAPSRHDPKKSGARLEIERLQREGVNPPVVDLDGYSVEDLLLQMVGSDNRAERECLLEVLRLKLAGYEE